MVTSEEHLAQAVDEALEQAWFREQRRTRRRLAYATIGRITMGLVVFWAAAIVAHLIVGVNTPLGPLRGDDRSRDHRRRSDGSG